MPELAADRRPQAHRHPVPDLDHVLLLHRRGVRGADPAGAADAAAGPGGIGHLQQVLHHARHHHDLPVPGAFGAGDAGELPDPDHDRARSDLAFPKINLLSWYLYVVGGTLTLAALVLGGVDTGWTFTTPLMHALPEHACGHGGDWRLHRRVQLHLHRAELHRDHPPHARAGDDVVPAAAVRVGELRGVDPDGAGHAGAGDHDRAGGAGADGRASGSSTRPRAATRCCSSTSSGSTRTRRCTS